MLYLVCFLCLFGFAFVYARFYTLFKAKEKPAFSAGEFVQLTGLI